MLVQSAQEHLEDVKTSNSVLSEVTEYAPRHGPNGDLLMFVSFFI